MYSDAPTPGFDNSINMVAALLFVFITVLLNGVPTRACEPGVVGKINDLPRRDPSVKWTSGKQTDILNDAAFNYNWYSAIHNGWQYIMVDYNEKPNYTDCSTYYPLYLKHAHPDVSSLTETAKEKIACVRDYVFPCDTEYSVKIRKCDGEVQYYLPPTKSNMAFCFKKQSQLFTTEPNPNDAKLGNVSVSPELHFNNIGGEMIPYMKMRCNFNVQTNYYYKINWYIDGDFLQTIDPTNNSDTFSIHEDVFKDNNIPMGFDIHCGVSVLGSPDGPETPMNYSEQYFVGIKVLNTTIYMNKQEHALLFIKPTVPIGCRINGDPDCTEDFNIFNADRFESACTTGGIANKVTVDNQRCSNGFQTLRDGEKWDPNKIYNFTIMTTDKNYDDPRVFYLKLEFSHTMDHHIWRDYQFPTVTVIVEDDEAYKGKICESHIDPHMRTSDGYYYEQQRHNGKLYPGSFLLYRNTKYGIEVQQKTTPCNNDIAVCACAVAVMAGQDVFMINRCGSINYLSFTRCDDGGILDVVKVNDLNYNIYTPIGTKITVQLWDNGQYFKTMNIDITMAPKDVNNTLGLCGYFDNDMQNDLKHRGGRTERLQTSKINSQRHHDEFSESWSLDKEEDLFLSNRRSLESWKSRNGLYCVCDSNTTTKVSKAVCSSSQYLNCTLNNSITETKCRVWNPSKRSITKRHQKETDRLFTLMNNENIYSNERLHKRIKREETPNTITEEEAQALCTEHINGSLAFTSYGEVSGGEDPDSVINQCIFDIVIGNDTSWATAHVESVNNVVKNMMDKEPSYVANNTEKVKFFMRNTCPGNCSNNGVCTETSECNCNGFYHGPNCLIDERDPLIIDDIEGGGECDLADGGDCECFYLRSSNILEGFTCKAITSKIKHDSTDEEIRSPTFSGGYEDIFTGVCCIQKVETSDWVETFVFKHEISVSNNGESFGNSKPIYVFDSTCQNVQNSPTEEKTFTLKKGYCFINGSCQVENTMSLAGCLACRSAVDAYNWAEYNPCQNGGKCLTEDQGYSCLCASGYKGQNCETDIDECASNPCKNGGTCSDSVNGYVCTCADGHFGVHCDIDENTCDMNKCLNGATCIESGNGRTCNCIAGYKGINCETNINECDSKPCVNNGTCTDGIDDYTCNCIVGYTGNNCETEINECLSTPCQNNGSCIDGINSYTCKCVSGYTGEHCETDINECLPTFCHNSGSCIDGINSYTCKCVSGYTGEHCETGIDECLSTPCQNNGSCIDGINSYTCKCVSGYTGEHCETGINECLSTPCQNNGSCIDGINSYTCKCVSGYTGEHCETGIDECLSTPCQNNGSCIDGINSYTCKCVSGYTGEHCETDIDECASQPCLNGGACTDNVHGYQCICAEGYYGVNCQTDTNNCISNPCQNNGECIDLKNGRQCKCAQGFEGDDCETNINECDSDPCENSGTCVDGVNMYRCDCKAGYTGTKCETDINECYSNPCENDGTCVDGVNMYRCDCKAGYTGTKCETAINECSSNPCRNDGKCVDSINSYTCLCVPGFTGRNCETDIDVCSSNPCKNGGSCQNRANGFVCECTSGYSGFVCENDDRRTTIVPEVKTTKKHLFLIFDINTSNINLSDANIQQTIRTELMNFLRRNLGNHFLGLSITSIRYGSVIVETDLQYASDEVAATSLAKAINDLVKGDQTVLLLNRTVSAASVTIDRLKVTKNSASSSRSLCATFVSLSETCDESMCVVENNAPVCKPEDDKGTFPLILIFAICGAIVLILILAIVCLCIRSYKLRNKKHSKDRPGFDNVRQEKTWRDIADPPIYSDKYFANRGYSHNSR